MTESFASIWSGLIGPASPAVEGSGGMSQVTAGLIGALIGALAGVGGGAIAQLVSSHQARRALLRHLAAEFISDLEQVRIGAIFLNAAAAAGTLGENQSSELLARLDRTTRRANEVSMSAGKKVKERSIAMLADAEEAVLLAPQLGKQDPRWTDLIAEYQTTAHKLQDLLYKELGN